LFLKRAQHELAGTTVLHFRDQLAHLNLTITLDQPDPPHLGTINGHNGEAWSGGDPRPDILRCLVREPRGQHLFVVTMIGDTELTDGSPEHVAGL
jgi:hypothetical protein